MGGHFLLQEIFPTQWLNTYLLRGRRFFTTEPPRKWEPVYSRAYILLNVFVVIQPFSRVWLFVTPWTIACQASLSFTSWSLLKLMSTKSGMPSNYFVLCHPLLLAPSILPSIRSSLLSWLFSLDGQSIRASASGLPMNIQDWFSLGWTGWTSLQSKGLSRVFSNATFQKHQSAVLSFLCSPTLTSIHKY